MTPETQTAPVAREVTFPVTGMTCASCVRRVEKALARVPGVREASVNLATEKAWVAYDPTQANLDQLRAGVEKAGYGVREMPTEAPAPPAAAAAPPRAGGELLLPIEGMTCASCVRRVEKALARVPGVAEASVNLATEKARVVADPSVGIDQLAAAVEKAGYKLGAAVRTAAPTQGSAAAPTAAAAAVDQHAIERQREVNDLCRKSLVSLAIGAVMMALTYVPLPVGMDVLGPLLLIAATVVQFWAGRVFYQASWAAARHGSANMNTLVAVGTTAAYGYRRAWSCPRARSTCSPRWSSARSSEPWPRPREPRMWP